ncbi:MAG: beta-N-acetylhexosaminidase [Armatimonadota bacterium]
MLVSIPQPRVVEPQSGTLAIHDLAIIFLPPDADALDLEAAQLLQDDLRHHTGRRIPISRAWRPAQTAGAIAIGSPAALATACGNALPCLPDIATDPEAYALVITSTMVILAAETPRGRLWAAQTLRQVMRLHGETVPQLRISDAPAMRYRGVLLDVARRKVPEVETLKALVDTMSLLKLNMLQLQVEHTFTFLRHPRIGLGCGSFTCEDILELDAHCRQRGVELVPMLQSFGHMRNVLALEEYRELAENTQLQWSLNATDPASIRFMDELYEEFLPCFSSKLINIGCDETIDLGRCGGRSNEAIAIRGKGRVYIDYLLALHKLLTEKYGMQVMAWGDIVLHYPELVPELPENFIMLNWGYEAEERYPQVEVFANAGLPQIICPGTSTWNTVFPRVNVAWNNVANFVRDGKAVGALGLLNTDWGDGGHYNLLGNSYYSYAHGAEVSWAAEPMCREAFDAVLGPAVFGPAGEKVVNTIRELGTANDQPAMLGGNHSLSVLCLFSSLLEEPRLCEVSREVLTGVAGVGNTAGTTLHHAVLHSYEPSAVADMAWAADTLAYAARKTDFFRLVIDLSEGKGGAVAALINTCENLLEEHTATVTAFRERWYAGNRHSEIDIALGRFAHAADALHVVHAWLQEHHADFGAGVTVALPQVPPYQPPWVEDGSTLWVADPECAGATA